MRPIECERNCHLMVFTRWIWYAIHGHSGDSAEAFDSKVLNAIGMPANLRMPKKAQRKAASASVYSPFILLSFSSPLFKSRI